MGTSKLLFLSMAVSVILSTEAQKTSNILHSKEIVVERLAEAATRAYQSRCNATCLSCVFSACSSPKSPQTTGCTTLYGETDVRDKDCTYQCSLRKLDYSVSNILTATGEDLEGIRQERCWTDAINGEFLRNYEQDTSSGLNELRWQYFASNSGLIRLYPAHTLRVCHVLNPLIRPWYVAATSGPKNVILVLDVSASMLNYGRLDLAKEAASTVVETLTNVDYATVVLFSDSSEQLLVPQQEPGTLLRASYENISNLSQAVRNISANPVGGTNFEAAITKAFDILDFNSIGPNFANCSTAILFLTDGFPNKGSTSQDTLIGLVRRRNVAHNAIMFTYTFGSNSGAALARGIACETSGVYTHIDDGGQLRDQLSLYYDYFALLRQTDNVNVAWVEPYVDAVGAGLLVTASKAIYDTRLTPPRLVGVVGVDVLVSDLRQAFEETGSNYEDVINFLASQNVCPSIQRFNESVLDIIRVQGGGEPCGSCEDSSCAASAGDDCSMPTAGYCDFEYRRYEMDPDQYREESCCYNESRYVTLSHCGSGAASLGGGSTGTFITAAITFVVYCAY